MPRPKSRNKFFKICLTGQKNAGKSSIFNALRGKPFSKTPIAEINYYDHIVSVNGENVHLKVWDTAGQEEYNSLTDNYYRCAKGIVGVFSLGCSESFQYLLDDIVNVKNCDYAPDACFFLVGNKTDISHSDVQVSKERIDDVLAADGPQRFGRYFETSAKLDRGIKELFDGIAHDLVAAHAQPAEPASLTIEDRYRSHTRNHYCACTNG
eukprot:gene19012-20924_t